MKRLQEVCRTRFHLLEYLSNFIFYCFIVVCLLVFCFFANKKKLVCVACFVLIFICVLFVFMFLYVLCIYVFGGTDLEIRNIIKDDERTLMI